MLNEGWREGCRERQRGNEEVDGVCYSHVAAWLADSTILIGRALICFDDCVEVEQDAIKGERTPRRLDYVSRYLRTEVYYNMSEQDDGKQRETRT